MCPPRIVHEASIHTKSFHEISKVFIRDQRECGAPSDRNHGLSMLRPASFRCTTIARHGGHDPLRVRAIQRMSARPQSRAAKSSAPPSLRYGSPAATARRTYRPPLSATLTPGLRPPLLTDLGPRESPGCSRGATGRTRSRQTSGRTRR